MRYSLLLIALFFFACTKSTEHAGRWYLPNGLAKIDINENGTYKWDSYMGADSGRWDLEGETIVFDDSTVLKIDSLGLTVMGHRLNKEKPISSIDQDLDLAGINFTVSFEGNDTTFSDTLSFSRINYYSTFNQKAHQYQIIRWDSLYYFTDDNTSNLGDRYALIEALNEEALLLNYYDNQNRQYIQTTWTRLP